MNKSRYELEHNHLLDVSSNKSPYHYYTWIARGLKESNLNLAIGLDDNIMWYKGMHPNCTLCNNQPSVFSLHFHRERNFEKIKIYFDSFIELPFNKIDEYDEEMEIQYAKLKINEEVLVTRELSKANIEKLKKYLIVEIIEKRNYNQIKNKIQEFKSILINEKNKQNSIGLDNEIVLEITKIVKNNIDKITDDSLDKMVNYMMGLVLRNYKVSAKNVKSEIMKQLKGLK